MSARLHEILDRRNAEIAQRKSDRSARADENRRRFPVATSLIDEVAELFGPVKVIAVREPGGDAAGTFGPRPGDICVQAVTEKVQTVAREPERVRKGRPATKDRWYAVEGASDE